VKTASDASIVDSLRAAPSGQRRDLLVAHLIDRTRHVLGIESDVPIDEHMALKDAGLDSLMAVELRNLLTRSLATSLPATLLFDYPSLDVLAAYLSRVLSLTPDATSAKPYRPHREAAQEVATLSDADAEALLLAELNGGAGPDR
jgi:acyl carrier protein